MFLNRGLKGDWECVLLYNSDEIHLLFSNNFLHRVAFLSEVNGELPKDVFHRQYVIFFFVPYFSLSLTIEI